MRATGGVNRIVVRYNWHRLAGFRRLVFTLTSRSRRKFDALGFDLARFDEPGGIRTPPKASSPFEDCISSKILGIYERQIGRRPHFQPVSQYRECRGKRLGGVRTGS